MIREDRFHCRNPLLAEDLRLQPQLVAALVAATLETKLNNNNHRRSFRFNDPSYIALACTFKVCMSLLGFALYFLHNPSKYMS